MIKDILLKKYENVIKDIEIYEDSKSIIISKIEIDENSRNSGNGSNIMRDITNYSDKNNKIIALTPSSDYGGDKNRLFQFYKRFNFKPNKGYYKSFNYNYDMIRYPKLNEGSIRNIVRNIIKELYL